MILKVIQSHRKWRHFTGHIHHFLLVVCSNNVSLLHRFRDRSITSFSRLLLRICDCLWRWEVLRFRCDPLQIKATYVFDWMYEDIPANTRYIIRDMGFQRFQTAEVTTFKVIDIGASR